MRTLVRTVVCALVLIPAVRGASAQTTSTDRLFLSFAEEAALAEHQWWEGQLEYQDWNGFDATLVRGVIAFQPWSNIEVGGRVAFGNTSASAGRNDGSGATDLDVWGKWLFQSGDDMEFAVGAVATVPTGDDAVGLGMDAFSLEGFGSLRYRMDRFILSGLVGARANGDGRVFDVDVDGKNSFILAGGVIYPLSDIVSAVGELRFESERFEEGERDTRVLAGLDWRLFNRGMLRGAVAVGLSDGAPDVQALVGYAHHF